MHRSGVAAMRIDSGEVAKDPMPGEDRTLLRDELLAHEPADELLRDVLAGAFQDLLDTGLLASLDRLDLAVIDPEHISHELRQSDYFTHALQALRSEKLVVLNQRFAVEAEAVIRSFSAAEARDGCPYSRSDTRLFALVAQIAGDPGGRLRRLRRRMQRAGADPERELSVRRQLRLVMLFFLGHEVGHLLSGHPRGQYAAFVDPEAPLERRLEYAAAKLCRHVDEFAPTQFGLPGFEQVSDLGSEVRREAERLRSHDPERARSFARDEAFFANEKLADEWADRILIEHLGAQARRDEHAAARSLFELARGVYAVALHSWYRDLQTFAVRLSGAPMQSLRELATLMARDREVYVGAASLFGESHRFTLLRAALSLEQVLRARSDWFDRPEDTRRIHTAHDDRAASGDAGMQREWWLAQCLQRYFLLCILMDTAVKMANVGCATGWMLEADRRRGSPQVLLMNYEPIEAARQRLRAIP